MTLKKMGQGVLAWALWNIGTIQKRKNTVNFHIISLFPVG